MQSSRNRQYPCYRYQTCLKPSATCPEEIREKNLWISAKMSISMHYSTHTHTHRGSDLISIDVQVHVRRKKDKSDKSHNPVEGEKSGED